MIAAVVAAALVAMAASSEGPRDYSEYNFQAYVSEFSKEYGQEEYAKREAIFIENMQRIHVHNKEFAAGKHTWWMDVNRIVDWTSEEFQLTLGHKRQHPQRSPGTLSSLKPLPRNLLPSSVDWRDKHVVTPVKNQGSCGSCWAFAATETVESVYAINSSTLLELAPQAYVSCMKNPDDCGGTGGCGGAIAELAYNFTKENGIPLKTAYRYTASNSPCKAYTAVVKVDGYVKLKVNDADALLTALATVGPIAVSVAASQWSLYGGGIFSGCTGSTGAIINHAVQAVGYADDYWLIRNSWGEDWGEKGYIRLTRAKDKQLATDTAPQDGDECKPYPASVQVGGECGVLSDSSYPTGAAKVALEQSPIVV